MFKYALLVCLVTVSLAQWVDPDWSKRFGLKHKLAEKKIYHPLPRSVQVLDDVELVAGAGATKAPATTTTTATPVCESMFGCSDCNTAEVCLPDSSGNLVQKNTMPCPTNAPYCDYSTGTCTTKADSRCGAKDAFLCSANGYFPDPSNCSLYHVCNDYKSSKFSCVNGQLYDPSNQECSNKVACDNITCNGQAQIKVPIGESQYFAYCRNGSPFVVTKCQGEYKLNATSQNCEAICEGDGLMADAEVCTSYYKCSTLYITVDQSVSIREHFTCPSGEAFQSSSYQCVPKTLTECKS